MRATTEFEDRCVLVVDDNIDTLEILSAVLRRRLGCKVLRAGDGAEALRKFEANEPDLILLDIAMPKVDGFETCRAIRARAGNDWRPVVFLTALDREDARERARAAGADDYLTKPFDPEVVLEIVGSLLRRRRADERAAQVESELAMRRDPRIARKKDVSVLFADIRNFTSLADQVGPEDVVEVLDRFIGEMSDVVSEHGGTINKILGDGLLVLFNDPIEQENHIERAVSAALAMRERARRLDAVLHTLLPEAFEIGIGVHTGPAFVGHIGSGTVSDYTAIGSTVNFASRLQHLAGGDQIVASHRVYAPLRERLELRSERREIVRGFAHPVRVAEIVSMRRRGVAA